MRKPPTPVLKVRTARLERAILPRQRPSPLMRRGVEMIMDLAASSNPQVRLDAARMHAYRKATVRLVPFLVFVFILAWMDRVNVGFAKLQMLSDLKFSEAAYGFGAGIFFVGYFLFEVPSNLLLERIGARKTLARITILWGLTSMAMHG